jgi:hypothetical protein
MELYNEYRQENCELIADFSIRLFNNIQYPSEYLVVLSHGEVQLGVHKCDYYRGKLVYDMVRKTVRATLKYTLPNGHFIF